MAACILEQLEMGDAIRAEGYQFAIEHRIVLYPLFKCLPFRLASFCYRRRALMENARTCSSIP